MSRRILKDVKPKHPCLYLILFRTYHGRQLRSCYPKIPNHNVFARHNPQYSLCLSLKSKDTDFTIWFVSDHARKPENSVCFLAKLIITIKVAIP